MSKQQVRTVIGLLTGHGHLQKYLLTIGVSDASIYIGNVEKHLPCEHNSMVTPRQSFMGKSRSEGYYGHWYERYTEDRKTIGNLSACLLDIR